MSLPSFIFRRRGDYNGDMTNPKKNAGWALYFGLVFLLAVIAAGTLIAFNISQQLKPEQFEAARATWQEMGPTSYVMVYKTTKNNEANSDHFVVKVRNRKTYGPVGSRS